MEENKFARPDNLDECLCPCCGEHRFDAVGEFDICPICGWEDDPVQRRDPDFAGGANEVSLREYKEAYYHEKNQ